MKKIYNICPYIYYRNDQFMKDCILIPYTFYQLYAIEPVIVTAQREPYTYRDLLPGLTVDIQNSPESDSIQLWIVQMKEYIRTHIQDMDLLFCFGCYELTQAIVPYYKQLKPDGHVILKLDMNSGWEDHMSMRDESLNLMLSHCTLITCEGKKLKHLLSQKWPYEIDYVTNGCLPNSDHVAYKEKENIILTVGRIGTEQKANEVLLEAFAACADEFSDWTLRLIGPVEQHFQSYITQYYERFPHLSDRVIFTGRILDKDKLKAEYRRAKIFAMTSTVEGGTPNVFSEAAQNGCYMVCSEIDAADEFTNWQHCGKEFPIGDATSLTALLREILDPDYDKNIQKCCENVQIYCHRYFDYTLSVKKMMHLLKLKGGTNEIQ